MKEKRAKASLNSLRYINISIHRGARSNPCSFFSKSSHLITFLSFYPAILFFLLSCCIFTLPLGIWRCDNCFNVPGIPYRHSAESSILPPSAVIDTERRGEAMLTNGKRHFRGWMVRKRRGKQLKWQKLWVLVYMVIFCVLSSCDEKMNNYLRGGHVYVITNSVCEACFCKNGEIKQNIHITKSLTNKPSIQLFLINPRFVYNPFNLCG